MDSYNEQACKELLIVLLVHCNELNKPPTLLVLTIYTLSGGLKKPCYGSYIVINIMFLVFQ